MTEADRSGSGAFPKDDSAEPDDLLQSEQTRLGQLFGLGCLVDRFPTARGLTRFDLCAVWAEANQEEAASSPTDHELIGWTGKVRPVKDI